MALAMGAVYDSLTRAIEEVEEAYRATLLASEAVRQRWMKVPIFCLPPPVREFLQEPPPGRGWQLGIPTPDFIRWNTLWLDMQEAGWKLGQARREL